MVRERFRKKLFWLTDPWNEKMNKISFLDRSTQFFTSHLECDRMKFNRHFTLLIIILGFLHGTLVAQDKNENTIKPGALWMDATGEIINAHGGCVIFYEGIYYWYGEEKVKGLSEKQHADGGVHCYASNNLVDWYDQGMVLQLSREDTLSDLSFDCNQDRPKVIYTVDQFEYTPSGKINRTLTIKKLMSC